MRGTLKNIFFLCFALLLFTACTPDDPSVLNMDVLSEQGQAQGSRRVPYATQCLNDATRMITFYNGSLSLPKDFCYDGTCFYFLYADRILKRTAVYPFTLISTWSSPPVDSLDYIDFGGSSHGVVAVSNSLRRIYTNLMNTDIDYMDYPADLNRLDGLSCNLINGTMYYFVTAIMTNNSRYRISYIWANGQLIRAHVRNLSNSGTYNFDFDDYVFRNGNDMGYNGLVANFWSEPPTGANSYTVEKFANECTGHGYVSGYSGKLEYLFMDRIDHGYYKGEETFIGLCYADGYAAVEMVYIPMSSFYF